jgi:hypothetical protein
LVVVPSGWFTMTQAAEAGANPAATDPPFPVKDQKLESRRETEVVGTQDADAVPIPPAWKHMPHGPR